MTDVQSGRRGGGASLAPAPGRPGAGQRRGRAAPPSGGGFGRALLFPLRLLIRWYTGSRRFLREVVSELRKVIYPSRTELVTYTTVVLFFVSAMVAIIAGLDYGFTRAIFAIFG